MVDDTAVEELRFGKDGSVALTIGSVDGLVAAPLCSYELTAEDALVIHGAVELVWTEIDLRGSEVHVNRNGAPAVYKIG